MTLQPLLLSLSLLLVAGQTVRAQLAPADDFFNSGAQFYISNNVPAALDRVETGLKMHPNDEKLKKLEQLLKQQQQQQQQDQQGQQQQQQDQNQNSQSQAEEQKKEDEEKKKEEAQKKEDEKKQPEQPQKQAAQQQNKADEKPDQQPQNQPPAQAVQMTPEDAKRLMDAQKGNEQLLQMKPREKPQTRLVKDW